MIYRMRHVNRKSGQRSLEVSLAKVHVLLKVPSYVDVVGEQNASQEDIDKRSIYDDKIGKCWHFSWRIHPV